MDGEVKRLKQTVASLRTQLRSSQREASQAITAMKEDFQTFRTATEEIFDQAEAKVIQINSRVSAAEVTITQLGNRGQQLITRVSATESEIGKLNGKAHVHE